MKPVVLVGAGALGLDAMSVHEALAEIGKAPRILGYLDDSPERTGTSIRGLPVLGGLSWLDGRSSEVEALVTIGRCDVRKRVADALNEWGVSLTTWIHPSVIFTESVSFGAGCLVMAGSTFTVEVHVGQNVVVNPGCTVAHEVSLGDHSYLSPGVDIAGRVEVEERVFFGTSATVIPGIRLESGSTVGAGAVVIRDVKSDQTVVGVPARPL